MVNFARARFKKLADGIRQRIQSASAESFHDENQTPGDRPRVVKLRPPEKVINDKPYFFDEEDIRERKIRVTSTHIEFGKHTYVLKYLSAMKRSKKKPPLNAKECQLTIAFTAVALAALLIYIFIGQLKFGLAAVVYLSLGLLALLVSSIVCSQMKTSYTLKFSDAQGEGIDTVTSYDNKFILRLEAAVKQAIGQNNADQS